MQQKMIATLLGAFTTLLFFMEPAHAYLDPGTGSILLQGLIAAVVGALVTGRLYWSRIKDMFSRKSGEKTQQDKDRIDD